MSEKEWLENKLYYPSIDETRLKSILYFTFVWNIFEKECCGTKATIGSHPKKLAEKLSDRLDSSLINNVFKYFQKRYIIDDNTNDLFNTFNFGREPASVTYKKFVKEKLLSIETINQDKLQVLLYIAFRLRNNLYHGIKDIDKLYEQNENFKQINKLLIVIIDNRRGCA